MYFALSTNWLSIDTLVSFLYLVTVLPSVVRLLVLICYQNIKNNDNDTVKVSVFAVNRCLKMDNNNKFVMNNVFIRVFSAFNTYILFNTVFAKIDTENYLHGGAGLICQFAALSTRLLLVYGMSGLSQMALLPLMLPSSFGELVPSDNVSQTLPNVPFPSMSVSQPENRTVNKKKENEA